MLKLFRSSNLLRDRELSEQLSSVRGELAAVQADAAAIRASLTAQMESARVGFEGERARLLRGYCPDIFGHSMYTNPNDLGVSLGSLNGRNASDFEGEIGYFSKIVKPGQTVLDIGANIGFFTLLFARMVGPTGRVYSFEPGPLSINLLRANIILNGYDNIVTTEHAAVSNQSGEVSLFVCQTGESDNRIGGAVGAIDDRVEMKVRAIALDDYFDDRPVDIIKMDIQGAEYMALVGMQNLIRRSPTLKIVMEYTPGAPSFGEHGPRPMLEFIEAFGFKMLDLGETGDAVPVSIDGLIAAVGGNSPRAMTNLVLQKTA